MAEKLIRDLLGNSIPKQLLRHVNDDKEKLEFLIKKHEEEWNEVVDAKFQDPFEYADLIEVIIEIARMNGITEGHINNARDNKKRGYGGFETGLIYDKP